MAVSDDFLSLWGTSTDDDKKRMLETIKPFWERAYGEESKVVPQKASPNLSQDISTHVANIIWLMVITGFMIVFIGITIIIAIAVLFHPTNPALPPETLMTIFTTIVGFLAGLLAPSPLDKKSTNG